MIQNKILGVACTMVVEEIVAEANDSFLSVVANESYNDFFKVKVKIFP